MSVLNKDILFLTFEELKLGSNDLFSCLLVNRFWCETIIPILWRNPWRYECKSSLYCIIIHYLSDDVKNLLTKQGVRLPSVSPLFDYLSFCKSIHVNIINDIIATAAEPLSAYNQFLLQRSSYEEMSRIKILGYEIN
jgi:hypothetical protein